MPVQRVRRVLRKIDPWTVLKVSLVFNAIMALVGVLGTIIFWSVFVNAGIPERINELALLIGLENGITLDGPTYFRVVLLLAIAGTIMMTGFFTLAAVVYNLISDLVGGVEVVVLEETSVPQASARPKVSLPVIERAPRREKKVSLPNVKPMRRSEAKPPPSERGQKQVPERPQKQPVAPAPESERKTGT
jgi:hypothetical protein